MAEFSIHLPLRLENPVNGSHGHWSKRKRWAKEHRRIVALAAGRELAAMVGPGRRWVVTLTRVAPRPFDDDNLAAAFKAIRDGIAAHLGVDDAPDAPVRWLYAQRKDAQPRYYGVDIEVALEGEAAVCPACERPF